MSRFDDLRKKAGIEPVGNTKAKPTLKTTNTSTRSVTPAAELPPAPNPNARPVRPTQISPGAPSFNIGNSPLIQQVNADRVEAYKRQLDTMQAEDNPAHFTTDRNAMLGVKARNIPILGGALRTLDTIGRKVEPVADVLRSFYIPGAGVGEIGALTGAAERGIARAFPKLASTAAGKLGQKVATEAIVGAPLGAAGTQMMNPDASIKDLAKGAALGAGLGAALPVAGSGISRLRNLAKNAANDVTENALRNVANTTRSAVKSPFVQGAAENPIARGYTEEVGKTFGNAPKVSIESAPRTVQQLRELAQQKKVEQTATQVQETAKPAPLQTNSNWNYGGESKEAYASKHVSGASTSQSHIINPAFNPVDTIQKDFAGSGIDLVKPKYGKDLMITQPKADGTLDIIGTVKFGPDNSIEHFVLSPELRGKGVGQKLLKYLDSQGIDVTNAKLMSEDYSKAVNKFKASQVSEAPTPGVRSNYKNQIENGNFSPELQRALNNTDQTYEVKPNAESVATANEAVKNLPKAEADFLLNTTGGAEHTTTGYRLMQELDAIGEHERALVVAKKLAESLTKAGQESQAASVLSRLSPDGQLLALVRKAEKNGKQVTPADAAEFKKLAAESQQKAGAGVHANQYNELLDRIERGETIGAAELKQLDNFLSRAEKAIKPKEKTIPIKDDLPPELKQPRKREKVISFLDDAEKAALERISKRRNNLNSLPLPEWRDHTIVVASQIAKGLIKASTHIEDLVKLFGEEIRPYASEVFQQAQKLLKSSSSKLGTNDIEQARELVRKVTGEKQPLPEKIVEKYLKENEKVSARDIEKLRKLAKQVTELSGAQKIDADIAMQKILNSYEKSSAWDKVNAIRYIAMLLNSGTQTVNALSGPLMASTGTLADILGSMISPKSTTLYGTNPIRFLAGYLKNVKTGVKAGFHGVNPAGIQGTNEIRGLTYKSNYNPLNWLERGLGAVAKGADYATYKTVFDSELVKQGYLDAKKNGVKGSKEIKKHVQKFVNDPTEAAIEQADKIGKNTTFQRSDSLGGKTANFLNAAPKAIKPIVNSVFPFVRTPLNIASSAVTMSPAGIIKGLYQLTSKSEATQREAIRTLSLGLTGSAGLGSLGYYLNKIGVITGANDTGDKDVNSIREQAGKGKYRFNTSALSRYLSAMMDGQGADAAEKAAQYQKGDKQFDYNKFQPLAFPLATGAAISENKGKPLGEKLGNAGEAAFGSLYGMSSLQGLSNVMASPLGGSTLGEKAIKLPINIAESFFKSFSPSALAQEARRQDPTVRKTAFGEGLIPDVKDYFKSRTPGLSKSLPPLKTTLGTSKQNASGVMGQYVNPYKSEVAPYNKAAVVISNLIDKTGDNTLAPSAPEKKVTGKDQYGNKVSKAIPAERYAKLQEQVGKEIIDKVLNLDITLSDADKATRLKKIYADAKAKYSKEVKQEMGVK